MFSQMASLYKLQRKLSMNTHQFIASNPIVPLNTHVIYLLMSQNLNSEQNTTHNLFAKGPIDQKSARLVKWLRIRIKLSNETMMAMVAHAYIQRKTSVHYFVCTHIYICNCSDVTSVTSHVTYSHELLCADSEKASHKFIFFDWIYIYAITVTSHQWRHMWHIHMNFFVRKQLTSLFFSIEFYNFIYIPVGFLLTCISLYLTKQNILRNVILEMFKIRYYIYIYI